MSEWKEIELFQIMEIVKNQFQADKNSDFKYIGLEHIEQESLRLNSFGHSSEVSSNKFFFKKGDILFGKLRPYFRKVIKVKFDGVCSTDIWVIRAKDAVFQDYLFYFLANWEFINIANAGEGGSRMPRADWNFLKNTKWLIPNLEEQKAIAEVLTSLDDKIDLLHKQNKTLEQLAETLFRHHFIDNAQDNWEIVKLGDIADIQNGFAFSSKDFIESGNDNLEVLKMGHIKRGGGLKSDPKRDFVPRSEKLRKWILDKGDIVMAMTDMKDNVVILGVPAMIDCGDKYVLNQRVARICLKPNKKLINNYLLYIQLKDSEFISELQTKANSGVQVNLSTQAIKEADIIVPPLSEQLKVSEIVSNFYLKMEQNFSHIKSLGSVRDQILPKLISGEIRLN